MKKLPLVFCISFLFSLAAHSQVQYATFQYPEFKVLKDTLNYTDTLTFSFRIFHNGCAIGPCNTFNDSLDFYIGMKAVPYDEISGSGNLHILQIINPYDSSPLYLPDGDTSSTVLVKVPLNQSVQLAGKVEFLFHAISPNFIDYWNSDTIASDWTNGGGRFIYITNPNCQANFQIMPTATPGSYVGYNLSTGSNLTYRWDFGDGNSSTLPYPTHTYSSPGRYIVCLHAHNTSTECHSNYCDSSFYVFKTEGGLMDRLEILGGTGVDEIESEDVAIYPNPVGDVLHIGTPNYRMEQISIYNLNGTKLMSQKFSQQIDISKIPAGIYIIELNNNADYIKRYKFIKL